MLTQHPLPTSKALRVHTVLPDLSLEHATLDMSNYLSSPMAHTSPRRGDICRFWSLATSCPSLEQEGGNRCCSGRYLSTSFLELARALRAASLSPKTSFVLHPIFMTLLRISLSSLPSSFTLFFSLFKSPVPVADSPLQKTSTYHPSETSAHIPQHLAGPTLNPLLSQQDT